MDALSYIAIAQIYNYFGDYELPYNDGIVQAADFIRAVQDGVMPHIYNSLVVNKLFKNMQDMNFYTFAQTIFAYRMWVKACSAPEKAVNGSDIVFMNFADFEATYTKFPKRLQYLIENTEIPSQEDIDKTSA